MTHVDARCETHDGMVMEHSYCLWGENLNVCPLPSSALHQTARANYGWLQRNRRYIFLKEECWGTRYDAQEAAAQLAGFHAAHVQLLKLQSPHHVKIPWLVQVALEELISIRAEWRGSPKMHALEWSALSADHYATYQGPVSHSSTMHGAVSYLENATVVLFGRSVGGAYGVEVVVTDVVVFTRDGELHSAHSTGNYRDREHSCVCLLPLNDVKTNRTI